jgi:two-component system, NtrC family, sensor histidine kinase KinB
MLRTRLYLGLLPLLLVAVGTGAYAIVVCRQLAGSFQRDLVASYRNSLAGEHLRAAATAMSSDAAAADRGHLPAARRSLAADQAAFSRELMSQSLGAAGTARAPLVAGVDTAFQALAALDQQILSGNPDRSLEAFRQAEDTRFRVVNAISALERWDAALAEVTAARAGSLADRTVKVLAVAMAAAFLLSLFLGWSLAASLLRPIQALTASALALGDGDLERGAPESSRDELGQLGRTFNTMAAKLRAYRDATTAKVLRAQRTMEAILTSTPDPLFVVSRDGVEEVRNPAAEQLAQSRDFGPGFPPGIAGPLERVLATGEHYLPNDYGRALALRVGREDRHYLPRILAIGDRLGEFKGAAILFQDVTKFRLLDDAKTNLVGTVSHELKTPLTSLRLAVYLLLEEKVGRLVPAQLELLETARDESDRLLRILDDLLDLARLESGDAALSRREVGVAPLLAEMAREAQPHLAAAHQRLVVCCPETVGTVSADVDRLRHVFLNFLTNAAKYAHPGATVTLYAEPAPLGFVRCGVRDEGPGIPPEAVPHIFDRFYRVPGSARKGAGLGLAIAREIVAAHGGTIACTSRPGEGSDFFFDLPGNSSVLPATKRG